MKKIIALALLLAAPVLAQNGYTHKSAPPWAGDGTPIASGLAITASGAANGQCVKIEGTSTALISISGTWVGTLSFYGTNDLSATQKSIGLYPYNSATGAFTPASVISTTANGDFIGTTNGFRHLCVFASAFTSNTSMAIRIDADPGIDFATTEWLGSGGTSIPVLCDKVIAMTTLGTTATVQQISAVAGQNIYVCGYTGSCSTATTGTGLTWKEGTGANCVTGTASVGGVVLTTPTAVPTAPNFTAGPMTPAQKFTATAGDGLCLNQASATNATTCNGNIYFAQF